MVENSEIWSVHPYLRGNPLHTYKAPTPIPVSNSAHHEEPSFLPSFRLSPSNFTKRQDVSCSSDSEHKQRIGHHTLRTLQNVQAPEQPLRSLDASRGRFDSMDASYGSWPRRPAAGVSFQSASGTAHTLVVGHGPYGRGPQNPRTLRITAASNGRYPNKFAVIHHVRNRRSNQSNTDEADSIEVRLDDDAWSDQISVNAVNHHFVTPPEFTSHRSRISTRTPTHQAAAFNATTNNYGLHERWTLLWASTVRLVSEPTRVSTDGHLNIHAGAQQFRIWAPASQPILPAELHTEEHGSLRMLPMNAEGHPESSNFTYVLLRVYVSPQWTLPSMDAAGSQQSNMIAYTVRPVSAQTRVSTDGQFCIWASASPPILPAALKHTVSFRPNTPKRAILQSGPKPNVHRSCCAGVTQLYAGERTMDKLNPIRDMGSNHYSRTTDRPQQLRSADRNSVFWSHIKFPVAHKTTRTPPQMNFPPTAEDSNKFFHKSTNAPEDRNKFNSLQDRNKFLPANGTAASVNANIEHTDASSVRIVNATTHTFWYARNDRNKFAQANVTAASVNKSIENTAASSVRIVNAPTRTNTHKGENKFFHANATALSVLTIYAGGATATGPDPRLQFHEDSTDLQKVRTRLFEQFRARFPTTSASFPTNTNARNATPFEMAASSVRTENTHTSSVRLDHTNASSSVPTNTIASVPENMHARTAARHRLSPTAAFYVRLDHTNVGRHGRRLRTTWMSSPNSAPSYTDGIDVQLGADARSDQISVNVINKHFNCHPNIISGQEPSTMPRAVLGPSTTARVSPSASSSVRFANMTAALIRNRTPSVRIEIARLAAYTTNGTDPCPLPTIVLGLSTAASAAFMQQTEVVDDHG